MHIALCTLELPPGSEVITTCITDMGTLTGFLYQGLVPVFADVDPETLNLDPQSVKECITEHTRAIVAVHHSGLAAEVEPLKALGLPVIEDCAQAYLTGYQGRLSGTFTDLATFSMNHFKHIECGSGGMVLTDDDRLRYLATLYLDKCYQREEKIRNPFFLAPNYQMTELQGAVALAQLERLPDIVGTRTRLGTRLAAILRDAPGISTQRVPPTSRHSYFFFPFKLDLEELGCTAREFSAALAAEGVPNDAHTITGNRPVHLYDVFTKRSAFPGSEYPFSLRNRSYGPGDCPVAEAAFDRWLTVGIYEHYTDTDIEEIGEGITKVAQHYAMSRASVAV